ncbi:MAG: PQQ-binding-like beta-propeller repeat protein, partial [Quisquiliibacterium sp.]
MSGPRSVVSWLLALSAIFSIAGCGNFWPWSGPKKPKMPDPPAISAPAAARQAWSIDLGPGGIGLVPAFAQDSVFAANRKGIILRLDVTTGQERWRVDLGRKVVAGVGTDARLVVVGLDDGGLVALDSDGKQKWSVTIGTQAATVPAVGHGVVVVRTGDNRVQAFEADTGKRRWSFTRQNPSLVLHQSSGITLTPSSAYVGLPGGRLVALDLASGAVRWEVAVAQPRGATEIERIADIVGTPMLRSGQVCAANYNG